MNLEVSSDKLFFANNHSNYRVSWQKVPKKTEADLREILSKHYGLNNIIEILQVEAWEELSNNFKIVIAGDQNFLLRRHIQHKKSGLLDMINEILLKLTEAGLKTPTIVKTNLGENLVYFNDEIWQMFEFISGDYYRGTMEDVVKAASAIASMQKILSGIKTDGLPNIPRRISMEEWKKLSHKLVIEDDTILKAIKKNSKKFIKTRKQVIHSDLHPHNILFPDGEVATIIDFGNIAVGDERIDLGSAVHRLIRQFIIYHDSGWKKQWLVGLQLFTEAYNSVREIPRDFLSELSFWMREAILRKVSQINIWYQAGERKPLDLKFELKKFSNLLLEIDAIENLYEKKIN